MIRDLLHSLGAGFLQLGRLGATQDRPRPRD
jgi:hypothetical protein